MAEGDKDNGKPDDDARIKTEEQALLIRSRMAEYQALTSRASYLQSIQAGIWPLIVIFLGIAIQVAKPDKWTMARALWLGNSDPFAKAIAIWGIVIVVQSIVVIWCILLWEQYQIILYLETRLRSPLTKIMGETEFLGFEGFLAERRNNGDASRPVAAEVSIVVGVLVLFGVALGVSRPFSPWDLLGLLNAIPFWFLLRILCKARKTRREWQKAIKERSQSADGGSHSERRWWQPVPAFLGWVASRLLWCSTSDKAARDDLSSTSD